MKTMNVLSVLAVIILIAGVVFVARIVLYPTNGQQDLSPAERSGYQFGTTSSSATSTASSTVASPCEGQSASTCPLEKWLTYTGSNDLYEFKYPSPQTLTSGGDVARIDFGYPGALRVTARLVAGSLDDVLARLESSGQIDENSKKKTVNLGGREAITVTDGSEEYGRLTYVRLTSDQTLFLLAEFTENFDADQALYGTFLSALKFR